MTGSVSSCRAGSCGSLAMRLAASGGARSRDVLALDVEAVRLCVGHGERFLTSGLCVEGPRVVVLLLVSDRIRDVRLRGAKLCGQSTDQLAKL